MKGKQIREELNEQEQEIWKLEEELKLFDKIIANILKAEDEGFPNRSYDDRRYITHTLAWDMFCDNRVRDYFVTAIKGIAFDYIEELNYHITELQAELTRMKEKEWTKK